MLDILAFSPHPDDAELYCSGTLLMLRRAGHRIGIADLTRGELSTRGTLETRAAETAAASRVLGLDARVNLDIPDGDIANTMENRLRVIRVLRALRPRTVLLPPAEDRHPDHRHASTLVRDACFAAGLSRIKTEVDGHAQDAHRPTLLFTYQMTWDTAAELLVDISPVFEQKLEAIRCYATQFHSDSSHEGPKTFISTPDFLEAIIARSRRLGFLIGAVHAEGLSPLQPFRAEIGGLLSGT